jgi:hypothetical protein
MRVNIIKASDESFVVEIIGLESQARLETFVTLDAVLARLKVVFA